jgi:hypothetical protein
MTIEARDWNGRPVVHFLSVLTDEEKNSVDRTKLTFVSRLYSLALQKTEPHGGRRYHNESFGGGISFPDDAILAEFMESIEKD